MITTHFFKTAFSKATFRFSKMDIFKNVQIPKKNFKLEQKSSDVATFGHF